MSITTYLSSVQGELKNIRWPSRRQAIIYTVIVVVVSLLTAAYIGGLDYIFTQAVEWLIRSFQA